MPDLAIAAARGRVTDGGSPRCQIVKIWPLQVISCNGGFRRRHILSGGGLFLHSRPGGYPLRPSCVPKWAHDGVICAAGATLLACGERF